MSLLSILLAVLIVIAIYLIVRWALGKLHVSIDNDLLVVGAVILLVLILLGRVNLGL